MSDGRPAWLQFGVGDDQWSAPDPRVASFPVCGGAYAYLVLTCPTTKLACEKLAKIRAAVRARAEPPQPGGTETGGECGTCEGMRIVSSRWPSGYPHATPCPECRPGEPCGCGREPGKCPSQDAIDEWKRGRHG